MPNELKCKYVKICRDAFTHRCDDCEYNETPSYYKPKNKKLSKLPPDSEPRIGG